MNVRGSLSTITWCLVGIGWSLLPASPAQAAEWLAPTPQAHIDAEWVQDVAKALRANRFKNVFMNQPFGCDQCRILEYLSDAADALESDEPKVAKSFVRRALSVLDDGIEQGWYDEADVRPIKRVIIKKAKRGFKEAGAPSLAMSVPDKPSRDSQYRQGDEPMFSRSDEPDDAYGSRRDRWSGYTSDRQLGLTNEPPDRDGRSDQYSRSQSRYGRQGRDGNPFSGAYGDLVERWGNQASHQRMSQEEFRQANQRHGAPEAEQSRFNATQQLKESANQRYDPSPMRGSDGQIRHPGD